MIVKTCLIFLLLTSLFAESYSQEDDDGFLYKEDDCQAVQAFPTGRKFYFTYEGTVRHRGSSDDEPNGFRVKCSRVIIRTVSNCAAKMDVENCGKYIGQWQSDEEELTFEENSDTDGKLNHHMHRFTAYFYFNKGEITQVFFHQDEPTDIRNMKKAILSALSLKFSGQGFRQSVNESFTIPNYSSIFGVGDSKAKVTFKSATVTNLTTLRDLTHQQLPNEIDSSIFRSALITQQTSDLSRFLGHKIGGFLQKYETGSFSNQTCQYTLHRHRRINEVMCTDTYSVPVFDQMMQSSKQLFHRRSEYQRYLTTNVTIHLSSYRIATTRETNGMTADDQEDFRSHYRLADLTFEANPEQSLKDQLENFKEFNAFSKLINQPLDETAPIFSKLILWITNQDDTAINHLQQRIMSTFRSQPELMPKVMSTWLQLLNECMKPQWCNGTTHCTNQYGCQTAFSDFLLTGGLINMPDDAQKQILNLMSEVENPNSALVQASMRFASNNPSALLGFGKVLTRHASLSSDLKSSDVVDGGVEYLQNILRENCPHISQSTDKRKNVEHAIRSLAMFVENNQETLDNVMTCMHAHSAPSSVLTAAIHILNNNHCASLQKVRRRLLSLVEDERQVSDVKLGSALVLLRHNPSESEIRSIVRLLQSNENHGLRSLFKSYIKTQIQLSGTKHSSLSEGTVEHLVSVLSSELESSERDHFTARSATRTFERERTISLPLLGQTVNGKAKATFYMLDNNPAPFKIDLALDAEIDGETLSVLNANIDVTRINPLLQAFIGSSGYLPTDMVHHLLNIPLNQWLKPLKITPPLLTKFGLKNLELIKDQFRLTQLISDLEKAPIFHLQVLGKPMMLNNFMELSFMKDVTIAKLLSLAEKLETGIHFNEHLLFAIGLSHGQIPTSIGLPLITNSELTSYVYPKINITIPLKQLYFTSRGEITFHVHPRYQVYKTIERSMRMPLGGRSGTAALVQVGMDSKIALELDKSPGKLGISIATLVDNSILSKKVNSLAIPWSTPDGFKVTSDLSFCDRSIRYPVIQRLGRAFHYRKCQRSGFTHDMGLRIDTVRRRISTELTWGPGLSEFEGSFVPSYSLNATMQYETLSFDVRKDGLTAEYLPLQNSIRITGFHDDEEQWNGIINLHRKFEEGSARFESISSSSNISSFVHGSVFQANGELTIKKNLQLSELEQPFSNFEDQLTHGMETGYDISGKLTLSPYRIVVGLVGRLLLPTPTGEFSAAARVFYKERTRATPLTTWTLKKEFVEINGVRSSKIEGTLHNISMIYVPTNLNVSMVWSNDTDLGYSKILRMESTLFRSLPGPFLDMRQTTKFNSADDKSNYDWNATITSTYVQGQWNVDARDEEKFTIKSRILLPKVPLVASDVQSLNYEEMLVSSDGPNTMYGIDVALGTTPQGHSNTTFFVISNGVKQYLHLTRNHINCDRCFHVELNTNPIKSELGLKIQPHLLHSSIFIDLNRPYYADKLGSLANSMPFTEDGLQGGYSFDAEITSNSVQMTGKIQKGNFICNTKGNFTWVPTEDVTEQHYDSKLLGSCYIDSSEERKNNFSLGLSYAVGEQQLLRNRHIQYNYSINSELMECFESFDIGLSSIDQTLKQLSLLRNSNYSFPDYENPFELNKHASANVILTRQNYSNRLWSYPVYEVISKGRIPSSTDISGGLDKVYNHSGLYFLERVDDDEEPFADFCGSEEECKEKLDETMEMTIQNSYNALLRLVNYIATEHQAFIDAPWDRVRRLTEGDENQLDISLMQRFEMKLKKTVIEFLSNNDGHFSKILDIFSFDESLLKMQHSFKMLSEMKPEENYDLTDSKIYIESLFRYIFEFDYALASVFENPMLLPSQLNRLKNHVASVLTPTSPADSELFKTFGVSFPESTQFVTVNKHLHELPSFPHGRCSWVGAVDTNDGVLTVVFNTAGLDIHFLDESLSQLRNGSFLFTDDEGNSKVLEYPFATKKCFCVKLTDEDVECFNFFTNMKFAYNTRTDEVAYYVETQGKIISSALKGLCGIPNHDIDVPYRLLPGGSVATDEAEFFNKHELTGSERCLFSGENFDSLTSSAEGSRLCNDSFSAFNLYSVGSHAEETSNLLRACSMKASSVEDTCKYTNLLVHSLRRSGVPVFSQESCISCARAEVQLSRLNLLMIISRSSDMPNATAQSLLTSVFERAYERLSIEGSHDVSVTLLTYGGPMEFYQPAVNTINGQISSSDVVAIQERISGFEFNGPSYDSHATIEALQFAANHLNVAQEGIFKHTILFAPETSTNNIGGKMDLDLIGQLNNDVTKFSVVGMLDDPDCNNRFAYIPPPFRGHCYESSNISPLIDELEDETSRSLNRFITCNCEEDPATGMLTHQCETNEANES